MSIIEANNRTRLLGLWDEHKELLAEYEELRAALWPEGGTVTVDSWGAEFEWQTQAAAERLSESGWEVEKL